MNKNRDFASTLMSATEVQAVLHKLAFSFRLILDSAGLLGLYVQVPAGKRAAECRAAFWDEYARSKGRINPGKEAWTDVPRPFDPDCVQFLSEKEIQEDAYLEQLFSDGQELVRQPVPHLPHWLESTKVTKKSGPLRVVFYSYKGGVGRTTALILTAILLARKGKRVAIIDFDLEAPGVVSFLLPQHRRPQKGVVDYFVERPALEKMTKDQRSALINDEYLGECELDFGGSGSISVLPAGQINKYYPEKLAYAAFEDIERSGENPLDSLFTHVTEAIEQLDYVLIDSRTGIADIGGSLLFKYAHAICACFYSNQQNREGMSLLAYYLGQRAREGRTPEVFWIHTMADVTVPGQGSSPHQELESHLQNALERAPRQPGLLQIPFLTQLRRLDWETLDLKRPYEDEATIKDYATLAMAIMEWGDKRRVNRKQ